MTKEEILQIVREELVGNLRLRTEVDRYLQTIEVGLILTNGELEFDVDSEVIELSPLFNGFLKKDY